MKSTGPSRPPWSWITVWALAIAPLAWSAEEFVGPLPGWLNAKADCGAAGDGKADDTAALQKGLDAIRKSEGGKRVLYLPAGAYRLTATLQFPRTAHGEPQGMAIYGEDPEQTVLKWDGPADGVMLSYNPWYSVMGRLTFDGAGKAATAVDFHGKFSTANEFSDLIVKDVQFGIQAGHMDTDGMAETAVLRCRWYRCAKAAISIQNFNSLDWYIWHNWFEDCVLGATNEFGAGNFHVYESFFLRSKEADLSTKHCGYFSFYRNLSIGSKAFYLGKRHQKWKEIETHPCQVAIQENTVLETADATPVRVLNNGPILLLDNTFSCAAGTTVVHNPPADQADLISIGNTYPRGKAVEVRGRLTQFDDAVAAQAIELPKPAPVPFLPRVERPVIAVPRGADAAAIQNAIAEAAKLAGKRPVVYLPGGQYALKQGLVIPAKADLQLVGDGIENGTKLRLEGPGAAAIRLQGPSRATLRNLDAQGGKDGVGLLVENADQAGGRVFGEQLQSNGLGYGLVVNGLRHTAVRLHDHGHNGIQVVGAGAAETATVALFCGASSRHPQQDPGIHLYDLVKGGRLLVRDIWYEGHAWSLLRLTDSGEFTYHCGFVAPYYGFMKEQGEKDPWERDLRKQVASLEFDGFRGNVCFSLVSSNGAGLRVKSPSPDLNLLLLGYLSNVPDDLGGEAVKGKVVLTNFRVQRKDGMGSDSKPGAGELKAEWARGMLKTLRETRPLPLNAVPDGATDLRLFRVMTSGKEGVRLQAGP